MNLSVDPTDAQRYEEWLQNIEYNVVEQDMSPILIMFRLFHLDYSSERKHCSVRWLLTAVVS